MRPSAIVNDIIAGILARAITRFGVDVFAFTFASNHFHALLRSRSCRIPAFMQYLRSNISKKLGNLVDWRGKFWDRRYDAEPVLDDDALVGRLRYILAHGVKEGLVARAVDWPGLVCIPELLAHEPREFAWPGGNDAGSAAATTEVLQIAPLPCWENHSAEVRKERILGIMNDIEIVVRKERDGVPVFGAQNVLAQDPYSKPQSIKRSPRPLCHASTKKARDEYAVKYREFADAYMKASAAYRSGTLDVEFPVFAHRPPWVVPRLLAA